MKRDWECHKNISKRAKKKKIILMPLGNVFRKNIYYEMFNTSVYFSSHRRSGRCRLQSTLSSSSRRLSHTRCMRMQMFPFDRGQ
jgi:hypothetical protein